MKWMMVFIVAGWLFSSCATSKAGRKCDEKKGVCTNMGVM